MTALRYLICRQSVGRAVGEPESGPAFYLISLPVIVGAPHRIQPGSPAVEFVDEWFDFRCGVSSNRRARKIGRLVLGPSSNECKLLVVSFGLPLHQI
jgi:hypothetical protein